MLESAEGDKATNRAQQPRRIHDEPGERYGKEGLCGRLMAKPQFRIRPAARGIKRCPAVTIVKFGAVAAAVSAEFARSFPHRNQSPGTAVPGSRQRPGCNQHFSLARQLYQQGI